MIVNTISEAKAQLSSLVEKARSGEDVIIGKAGKPVAVLTSYSKRPMARVPGALRGQIRIASDFDELPEDLQEVFGMRDA